jgi:hypothetical protein
MTESTDVPRKVANMNRRAFAKCVGTFGSLLVVTRGFCQSGQSVDPAQLGFDIVHPQSHCNQQHAHDPVPAGIDPRAQLNWSAGDTGFNEGAEEGVKLLARYGIKLPPPIDSLAGKVAGNVWKRRDMMAFAKTLAKAGGPQNLQGAVGLAILSQWHNCHAFRTLLWNVPVVIQWVQS